MLNNMFDDRRFVKSFNNFVAHEGVYVHTLRLCSKNN